MSGYQHQHQHQHQHWGAEALWQRLEPLLPGLSVEVLVRAESTNTLLLDRARAMSGQRDARVTRPGEIDAAPAGAATPLGRRSADVQPCLLVAEEQTRGRGRLGRGWTASTGASLTFSLALPLAPAAWAGLSLAVGLALAEALDPWPRPGANTDTDTDAGAAPGKAHTPLASPPARPDIVQAALTSPPALPRIMLKWPNDLWLADGPGCGRKLGGVLIEAVNVGQRRMCVIGVGLNVLPQPHESLTHGYACLHEIDPGATAPAALARVAEPLVRAVLDFQAAGFAPLVAAYARRDLLRGQPVSTTLAEASEGVAEGVAKDGALLVRCNGLHRVIGGEVSVRLRLGAA